MAASDMPPSFSTVDGRRSDSSATLKDLATSQLTAGAFRLFIH